MTYDGLGEMLTFDRSTTHLTYGYDPFGMQWQSHSVGDGSTTAFICDGVERVAECLVGGDGDWDFERRFTHGPSGSLYQERLSGQTTHHRWFHGDGLGSVWSATGSQGTVMGTSSYRAFGTVSDSSGMGTIRAGYVGMAGR